MSGYQFLRIDTYAMAVPKLRAQFESKRRELGKEIERKLSVEEICYEAGRVPGNHQHIVEPEAPVLLFGLAPDKIPARLQARIDEKNAEIAAEKRAMPRGARRGGPRAIRGDSPVLIAVVGSHPFFMKGDGTDYPSLDDPQCRAAVEMWKVGWVEWKLKEAAARGAQVISIVEHVDEGHPHLHAFEIADNLRLDARAAHPGFVAKRGVTPIDGEDEKATARRANTAYRAAMVRWQDEHHQQVSVDHGLLRIGPRRRRLRRAHYLEEKKAADGLARMRAAERDEKVRSALAAAERTAAEVAASARLEELEAAVMAQEDRREEARRNAEVASALEEKAVEHVTAQSERIRQIEKEAKEAEQLAADLKAGADREATRLAELLAERERVTVDHERRERESREALSRLEEDGKAMVEQLEARKKEFAEVDAGVTKREADEQRLTDERSAIAAAHVELACAESAQRRKERELNAKLEGLDAYLDRRIWFANEAGDQPRLVTTKREDALLRRISPAAKWLSDRLYPFHEAERKLRTLTTALIRAAKEWAVGRILGVGKPNAEGRPTFTMSAQPPGALIALIDAHREEVAELIAALPDRRKILRLQHRIRAILPLLREAEAKQVGAVARDINDLAAQQRSLEDGCAR